jgi:hypothetical protein
MGEITQFIAMPFDLNSDGRLAAGEPFKCASPASTIERAKGFGKYSDTPEPLHSCVPATRKPGRPS